jgi:7-cyano-7-deazaguanine synthase
MTESALVVLSGGQDSTTCLFWAIDRFGPTGVQALTFDYGQRHRIELDSARQVAEFAGVDHTVLPADTFAALGGNALTDDSIAVDQAQETDLPATFVPGRNLIFLTYAAAFCWPRKIRHIVTGVAQTDYSGYPDCRRDTIDALTKALCLGMEVNFEIHTPLMNCTKAETVQLAQDLGCLDALALTHTCYEGERPPCGHCQACQLRAKGFAEAGVADPLTSA